MKGKYGERLLNTLNIKSKKTLHFHGEFSSLTITIFPSFTKKTNEIIQRN